MRSPWTDVGTFDRETRSHVVDRIPRPPEARAYFEHDLHGRDSIAGYELKVGCSKCFQQTIVCWRKAYSDCVLEQYSDAPELMAVAVAKRMTEIAQRADVEASGARRREAESRALADWAVANFKRIQVKRSTVRKRKERKRRSRNRGKR